VMKISGFIKGVRHAQLCEKLGEEFPSSFDSLMDKVRAFVRGKDTGNQAKELDSRKGGSFGKAKDARDSRRGHSGPYAKGGSDMPRSRFQPYK
jgi:hypothetical protein